MTGDLEAARATPAPAAPTYVAPSTETHTVLDHGHVERMLNLALVAQPPRTLASIYVDLRVDRSYVRRRYPRECVAIRERREAWDAARQARVRAERAVQIRQEVARLTSAAIYPSRNQLRKSLPGIWLRRPEFVAVWRDAVVEAGWGDPSGLRRVQGQPTRAPALLLGEVPT